MPRNPRGAGVRYSFQAANSMDSEAGGRLDRLTMDQDMLIDYTRKITGECGCYIILGLVIIIPISMIAMGSLYLYDCPAGESITTYLIVAGITTSLQTFLRFGIQTKVRMYLSLFTLFSFGWFITGSIWIFSIYEPNYDKSVSDTNYCDKTLYLYAFWITIAHYALAIVLIIYLCVVCQINN